MRRDKIHYFTEEFYINPGNTVWFNSACKLAAASKPTSEQPVDYRKREKVTCQRCLQALQKRDALKVIKNATKFKVYKEKSK